MRYIASRALGQITIALWDNISGPRVEYVWSKDWNLNPPQSAQPSKLNSNIIEDYISPSALNSSSTSVPTADIPIDGIGSDGALDTAGDSRPSAPSTPTGSLSDGLADDSVNVTDKKRRDSTEESGSDGEEEPPNYNHLRWECSSIPMELANYVARYTLGGELVEIAGAGLGGMSVPKQRSNESSDSHDDLLGKSPSFFDPLYLSSSPTASGQASGGPGSGNPAGNVMTSAYDAPNNASADAPDEPDASMIPPRSVSDQRAVPIDYKMHVFDEANYFTEAALFTAPYVNPFMLPSGASSQNLPRGQKTKFAISVLLPKEFLGGYLRHHEAMLDRLQQLVVIYLYLLQLRPLHASALLHHALIRLVAQMNDLLCVSPPVLSTATSPQPSLPLGAIYSACSRRQPPLQKTIFAGSDLNSPSGIRSLPSVGVSNTAEERSTASVGNYGKSGPSTPGRVTAPSAAMLDFAAAFVAASEGGSAKLPTSNSASFADAETQQQRQRRSKAKAFLSLILTSHLQTHFRTVVLGDDINSVNQYVNTLLLFVPAEDRERCAEAAVGRGYVPDLLVQGVLGKRIPDEAIIQSIWPTTLVDLNSGVVTQTYPFHEYKVLRREYQKSVIQKLLKNSSRSTNLWTAQESVFQPVKEPSLLVKKVVSETLRVPAYLRPGYFSASFKGLIAKTYVLIKYVEAFSRQQQVRLERERRREMQQQQQLQLHNRSALPKGPSLEGGQDGPEHSQKPQPPHSNRRSSPSPLPTPIPITLTPATAAAAAAAAAASGAGAGSTSLALSSGGHWSSQLQHPYPIEFTSSPHLIQRIQRDLELTGPCYYVLLGMAELIKPGIYRALAGDPASQELRWIELFESF
jgi:hypothetical protein